jgi:excinuclease ABC subunit C
MAADSAQNSFDSKAFVRNLTERPGVYRMLNVENEVLYVGKARNLKKRVGSYFTKTGQSVKTISMLEQLADIEVTITNTESEALILENNLIKEHKPRYNILLRDDKTYPYIYISTDQKFPRLGFHRGARKGKGRYFGPYPSAGSIRETLNLLQKLFPVRQCEDSFFANRSRPCLQYQIKRCSAPCVDYISEEDYAQDVQHSILFLEGKNDSVINALIARMEEASTDLDYEKAAQYRDQVARLRGLQEQQLVSSGDTDCDIVVAVNESGTGCVQVFTIRNGHNLGNRTYYPKHTADTEVSELLSAFVSQYYLPSPSNQEGRPVPPEVMLNHDIDSADMLAEALSAQSGHRVQLNSRFRGERARRLQMAQSNAMITLRQHLSSRSSLYARFEELQDKLILESIPQRIECFDISHTMGEETVASCVVFTHDGPLKNDYRRYNITGITAGDDFAAMRQALLRRYTKIKQGEGKLPDVLLIDGGKGQLKQAAEVLEELQLGDFAVIGVAKGRSRKPGEETLFLLGQEEPFILNKDSPALLLIQQVRDEAHRFAITGHRQRRGKKRSRSVLEDIAGLGPKRRQQLLKHFGGLQALSRAGVDDLEKVNGISRSLAQRIYDVFHDNRNP